MAREIGRPSRRTVLAAGGTLLGGAGALAFAAGRTGSTTTLDTNVGLAPPASSARRPGPVKRLTTSGWPFPTRPPVYPEFIGYDGPHPGLRAMTRDWSHIGHDASGTWPVAELPDVQLSQARWLDLEIPRSRSGRRLELRSDVVMRNVLSFQRMTVNDSWFLDAEQCTFAGTGVLSGAGLRIRRCRIGAYHGPVAGGWIDHAGRRVREGIHAIDPEDDGIDPTIPNGRQIPPPPRPDRLPLTAEIAECHVAHFGRRRDGRHQDGLQTWGGTWPLLVRDSFFWGWLTSGLMLKSEHSHLSRVSVHGCYVGTKRDLSIDVGAGYPLYCRDHHAGTPGALGRPTYMSFTSNVLDRGGSTSAQVISDYNGNYGDHATYVRTSDERDRGVREQEADPSVLERRRQVDGLADDACDARTWVVWADNLYPDGSPAEPPGGWFDVR